MFLLIDNYDSFTSNLVQAFCKLGQKPLVLKNDDTNSLKQVVEVVEQQLSAMMPAMMGF